LKKEKRAENQSMRSGTIINKTEGGVMTAFVMAVVLHVMSDDLALQPRSGFGKI